MTNIDPAIVEALAEALYEHGDEAEWLTTVDGSANSAAYEYVHRILLLIAAAVDAARAEGDKQGAARVREAVEAVRHRLASFDCTILAVPRGIDVPDDYESGLHDAANLIRAALIEAAPE